MINMLPLEVIEGKITNAEQLKNIISHCTLEANLFYLNKLSISIDDYIKNDTNFKDLPTALTLLRLIKEQMLKIKEITAQKQELLKTQEYDLNATMLHQETTVIPVGEISKALKQQNQEWAENNGFNNDENNQGQTLGGKVKRFTPVGSNNHYPHSNDVYVNQKVASVSIRLLLYCLFITIAACALLTLLFRTFK